MYQRKESPPLKWVIAGVLFLIVLGVTWNEANGYSIPSGPSGPTHNSHPGIGFGSGDSGPSYGDNPIYTPQPIPPGGYHGGDHGKGGDDGGNQCPVPEPSTLMLLASGLSLGFASRMRKFRA